MFFLDSFKALSAVAGVCAVGVWVSVFFYEDGWAVFFTLATLVFVSIARRHLRLLREYTESVGKVKFFCVQERRNVWSTHISGRPEKLVNQLWWHFKAGVFNKGNKFSGIKLVLNAADRLAVRRRSLECFTQKLDQLACVENAVLITASALNDPARGNRLLQRIHEIEKRTEWQYQLIERKIGVIEGLWGRFIYGWQLPKKAGFWRPYVPGLVAWRKQDKAPELAQLNAKPMKIYVLNRHYDFAYIPKVSRISL